jgi:predicted nucleic acid-binding protein
MAVVVDSSAVLALADRSDPEHDLMAQWIDLADDELVISPLVAAQADALLRAAGGAAAGEAFAADLESGAYVVRWWADAMVESAAIVRAQRVDLTDASSIAVAARARTNMIATTRRETWRRLVTPDGSDFEIVPARQRPRPQLLETA